GWRGPRTAGGWRRYTATEEPPTLGSPSGTRARTAERELASQPGGSGESAPPYGLGPPKKLRIRAQKSAAVPLGTVEGVGQGAKPVGPRSPPTLLAPLRVKRSASKSESPCRELHGPRRRQCAPTSTARPRSRHADGPAPPMPPHRAWSTPA